MRFKVINVLLAFYVIMLCALNAIKYNWVHTGMFIVACALFGYVFAKELMRNKKEYGQFFLPVKGTKELVSYIISMCSIIIMFVSVTVAFTHSKAEALFIESLPHTSTSVEMKVSAHKRNLLHYVPKYAISIAMDSYETIEVIEDVSAALRVISDSAGDNAEQELRVLKDATAQRLKIIENNISSNRGEFIIFIVSVIIAEALRLISRWVDRGYLIRKREGC